MTDLLTRLEQATEGSRELDARITAVVKGRTFKDYLGQGAYTAEGSPGDFGGNSLDTPHYTTSLDAALPWENIIQTHIIHLSDWGKGFSARHEAPDGQIFDAKAHTEPLARRIAALRAGA